MAEVLKVIEIPVPALERRRITHHAGIAASVGAGYLVNEFAGEYVARLRGAINWDKALTKGITKSAVSGFMLLLATQVKGAALKAAFEFAGYAGLGSILLDVLAAMYPGGIPGIAAAMALRGRAAAPVRRAITQIAPGVTLPLLSIAPVEQKPKTPTTPTPSI